MSKNPVFWLVVLALLLLTGYSSVFTVDQRDRAVLFQLGEIKGTDFGPGLHFKIPFLQSVDFYNGRVLTLDSQVENFLTAEKKNVEVDYYVKWRIANTTTYYRATGGQQLVAMDRLSSIVNRNLRDQFGSMTIQQAVAGERNSLTTALEKATADKVKDLGIQIVDVRVKRIDLPKEVSASVYDRMRAERTRVASDLRARGGEAAEKIRADADQEAEVTLADAYRDAEKIRGEGDAKAADIYAKAYGQDPAFYSFYRSLSVYRDAFSSKQDVLVLEPKGELFRYFKGDGAGK
ncbi:MAG: protease modulator HflC [Stenotrophobium sp.]